MTLTTIFCNRCGRPSTDDAGYCQNCGAAFPSEYPLTVQPTSQSVAPRFAGFWIRVVAGCLDFMLMFAASFPVKALFGSIITAVGIGSEMPVREILVVRRVGRIAASILLVFAYRATMESSPFLATLGKLAVRLKVTDLEDKRISFGRASGRYFAKWLSALALGLGYLMVAFDEEKQGLHDRIAGTLVQYRNSIR